MLGRDYSRKQTAGICATTTIANRVAESLSCRLGDAGASCRYGGCLQNSSQWVRLPPASHTSKKNQDTQPSKRMPTRLRRFIERHRPLARFESVSWVDETGRNDGTRQAPFAERPGRQNQTGTLRVQNHGRRQNQAGTLRGRPGEALQAAGGGHRLSRSRAFRVIFSIIHGSEAWAIASATAIALILEGRDGPGADR